MSEAKKINEAEPAEQEELISIRLPLTKDLQDDVFVRVNQRTWLIKRGVNVVVPRCVVEVLEHSEEAMLEALQYQQAHLSND
ncbi:MAG: hypothetical protein IK095_02190 [Oscillospiraceae bacterium]|nr:hypothetical protein [Oscillospiraceae bacterium]